MTKPHVWEHETWFQGEQGECKIENFSMGKQDKSRFSSPSVI